MPSVEEELASRIARGEPVVLATVIKLDGEPPSQPGAKLLMSGTMSIAGTLGCSEFDSAALADSESVAAGGAPQMRSYRHDLGSIDPRRPRGRTAGRKGRLETSTARGRSSPFMGRWREAPEGLNRTQLAARPRPVLPIHGEVARSAGGAEPSSVSRPPTAGPPHSWGGGAKRRRG